MCVRVHVSQEVQGLPLFPFAPEGVAPKRNSVCACVCACIYCFPLVQKINEGGKNQMTDLEQFVMILFF